MINSSKNQWQPQFSPRLKSEPAGAVLASTLGLGLEMLVGAGGQLLEPLVPAGLCRGNKSRDAGAGADFPLVDDNHIAE